MFRKATTEELSTWHRSTLDTFHPVDHSYRLHFPDPQMWGVNVPPVAVELEDLRDGLRFKVGQGGNGDWHPLLSGATHLVEPASWEFDDWRERVDEDESKLLVSGAQLAALDQQTLGLLRVFSPAFGTDGGAELAPLDDQPDLARGLWWVEVRASSWMSANGAFKVQGVWGVGLQDTFLVDAVLPSVRVEVVGAKKAAARQMEDGAWA